MWVEIFSSPQNFVFFCPLLCILFLNFGEGDYCNRTRSLLSSACPLLFFLQAWYGAYGGSWYMNVLDLGHLQSMPCPLDMLNYNNLIMANHGRTKTKEIASHKCRSHVFLYVVWSVNPRLPHYMWQREYTEDVKTSSRMNEFVQQI